MNKKHNRAGAILSALGKAFCYLLLFLLAQTLVTVIYTVTITVFVTLNPEAGIDLFSFVLSRSDQISLISAVLTLAVLVIFFLLRKKNPLREVCLRPVPGRWIGAACSIIPALYAVIIYVLSVLPAEWMESYLEASAGLNQQGFLIFLATVAAAPLVEEIIFRGLMLSRLRRAIPGGPAVLLSALLFALCHGQILWICYAFVLGLLFGLITLRTGSVLPTLCAHVLFNAIGHISVYLPQTDSASMIFLGALLLISLVSVLFFRRDLALLLFPKKFTEKS